MVLECLPVWSDGHEEVKNVRSALKSLEWPHWGLAQRFFVSGRDLVTTRVPGADMGKLGPQNSGLDLVETAVHAGFDGEVTIGLPIGPEPSQALGERTVSSDHDAAVSKRTQVLRRIEAVAPEPPNRPGMAPSEHGAVGLRAILDDLDVMFRDNL